MTAFHLGEPVPCPGTNLFLSRHFDLSWQESEGVTFNDVSVLLSAALSSIPMRRHAHQGLVLSVISLCCHII